MSGSSHTQSMLRPGHAPATKLGAKSARPRNDLLPAGGRRHRLYKRINPIPRIRLIVRADIDDVAFHDEDGDVAIYLLEQLGVEQDARMPGAAGEGGMEDDAVAFVLFDILDQALYLRQGAGALPRLVVPVGPGPHPSPGDMFERVVRLRDVEPVDGITAAIRGLCREYGALAVKILKITEGEPGGQTGAPEEPVFLILRNTLLKRDLLL